MNYDVQLVPTAFEAELMPELQEGNGSLQDGMQRVCDSAMEIFRLLKEQRSSLQLEWDENRDQYEMAEYLALDENRRKSIQLREARKPFAEMEPERASMVLPLCYEAERLLEANLYKVMRGYGSSYCEFAGNDKNDRPGAEAAEEYLNYQFHYQIPTPHIIGDFLNHSLVEGTGIIAQTWDPVLNLRQMEAVNPRLVWIESVPYLDRARVAAWRRYLTKGEVMDAINVGAFACSQADLDAAMTSSVVVPDYIDALPTVFQKGRMSKASDRYQLCTVDIIMESYPRRWVYLLNEKVVIAVRPWLIPPDEGTPKGRFPFTVFSPNRKPGTIYGDSFIKMMSPSQDMAASIMALLLSNLQSNAMGVPITNNPDLDGKAMLAGYWTYSPDPASVQNMKFPDVSQQLIAVVEYIRNRISDPISGATASLRGQPAYSGMPATGIRDLLQEASTRLSQMEDLGVFAMQDVFTVALLLNQRYLQPTEVMRVTGNGAIWRPGMPMDDARPMDGQALFGVSGKDIIPSGLPIAGGKHRMILDCLNDAAVIMQTGGNPQAIMKRYIKTKYGKLVDENEVYPMNGIGNDPLQENANLKLGMPISLDPDDNDQWHIQAHSMMQFDKEFLAMVQTNPKLWIALNAHMAEHISRVQQQAAEMGGAVQSGPGGYGSGTGASGKNLMPVQPDPKKPGELQAQMEAQQ